MLPKDWLFLIPNQDNYILYAPLHKKTVRLTNEAALNSISILDGNTPQSPIQNEIWNFFSQNGLLVPPPEGINKNNKNLKIFLSITNKCNLRCLYCYANSGSNNKSMDFSIAKSALDYQIHRIIASNDDTIAVTFHGGGEAFVELALLKKIVIYINEAAKRLNLKTRIGCVTNATLITNDVAKWLAENFSHLSVSFDGPQEIQNTQRPAISGSNSYDKAMSGIENLIEEKVNFSIRSTITNFSVTKMGEQVYFVQKHIFPYGGSITFEPVSLSGRAKNADNLGTDGVTFFENYVSARQIGLQIGIDVTCSMDVFGSTKESFCGATQAALQCFTPDGKLSACTRFTKKEDDGASLYFYGNVNIDQVNIETDARNRIIAFGTNYPTKCRTCYARWNCQGGCSIARYSTEQDNFEQSCFVTKELLLYDLKRVLNHSS